MSTAYDSWKTHNPQEDEVDIMDGYEAWRDEADWQKEIGDEGVHFLLVDILEGRDIHLIQEDLDEYLKAAYLRHTLNLQQDFDNNIDDQR